jgi:hypothetical protein
MSPDRSISSPPPSERPLAPQLDDARDRLNQLAQALACSRDARHLAEFLRLRAALRV